jgi:hypothetical protein
MRKIVLFLVLGTLPVWGGSISPRVLVAITTPALPEAVNGQPYRFQLTASGCGRCFWSASGLPRGLSVSTSGLIHGTPAASGIFKVTVGVRKL